MSKNLRYGNKPGTMQQSARLIPAYTSFFAGAPSRMKQSAKSRARRRLIKALMEARSAVLDPERPGGAGDER